jgi:peptide/nickel transport system permease protein
MRLVLVLLSRTLLVVVGAALATFVLLWNAPGDAASAIAIARFDQVVSPEIVARIREEAGLDAGFWQALMHWLFPLLQGDLGRSADREGRCGRNCGKPSP